MIVDVRRSGRILVTSMQRPEKRNAVNRELAYGISAALDTLDDDDELWVGVLTGTTDVLTTMQPMVSTDSTIGVKFLTGS